MDRRESLKALALGTVSATLLLEACGTNDKAPDAKSTVAAKREDNFDRQPEEKRRYEEVTSYKFFSAEEMATITILGDIIIPKDDVSGSASDAGVPDFIEFIVKDMPEHQVPMRGGLRWLDLHCLRRYEKPFKDCSKEQQMEIVNEIAWPNKAKPEMRQGVAFFNRMRDLTATGFYTSEIGVKDLGYVGNTPNQWKGVPEEVLKQYNLAYSEREMKETITFDS